MKPTAVANTLARDVSFKGAQGGGLNITPAI